MSKPQDVNKTDGKAVLDIQAQLRAELESAKTRVDRTGFSISTKAKQFSLPDGTVSAGPLKCIVLDWVSLNLYYTGAYNPQKTTPPDCWALGRNLAEIAPDKDLPGAQSTSCHECPKNAWGSDTKGGKGKACKNTRRLLVVPAAGLDKSTAQYTLNVSPTGIKHFDQYVLSLVDRGISPLEVITEISFDPTQAYPSLRFKADAKHEEIELVWGLREGGQAMIMSEPRND